MTEHDRRAETTAYLILSISVLSYASCVILARVVYAEGGNALTVLIARMAIFFVMLSIYFKLTGKPTRLTPRDRIASLGLGVLVAFQSWCYYSAFQHIPVSLATLIFYTYPIFVALSTSLLSGTRLTPLMIAVLLTAFFGIFLVLEVSLDQVETHGLLRAAGASLGMTITVYLSTRILSRVDPQRMTLHSSAVTSCLYVLVAFGPGEILLPHSVAGWIALLAVPVVYVSAVLGFYSTIPVLGPVRASFISNCEPLTTIVMAALLLGEKLTPKQMAGGLLVLGAVAALQIFGRRKT
jgi:drug/metabolite transporter (DMT)-like permease